LVASIANNITNIAIHMCFLFVLQSFGPTVSSEMATLPKKPEESEAALAYRLLRGRCCVWMHGINGLVQGYTYRRCSSPKSSDENDRILLPEH
jgi:hypothetical protein